jgi:hypothetical protein
MLSREPPQILRCFASLNMTASLHDGMVKRCVGVRDDSGKMAAAFNDCERTCATNTSAADRTDRDSVA